MPAKLIRPVLLLYGLLNSALYSSLLPLWEGFDEEFHYGYVQYLVAHHRFPVLSQTGLSEEINRSIGLLPMSHVMIDNLHLKGVLTFDRYFALPSLERHQRYQEAHRLVPGLADSESDTYYSNYEVHHAPLAYLLMAVPEQLLRPVPLPRRVWLLRLLASLACVLLMYRGVLGLAAEASLRPAFSSALLFLIFSCQMFWATIAHIGNDWLAVPLAVWLIVWTLRCHHTPNPRSLTWLASILALGLLSKAYFLVFVPLYLVALAALYWRGSLPARGLALCLALPALLAGPWYLRNIIVYGNLSGRLEESSGVSLGAALTSLASIPWLRSLPFMARGAIWMGNSSFTDFSVHTMNVVLASLAIALLAYCWTLPRRSVCDAVLWAPVLLFCAAMIYVTGSSYSFTKGLATAASPWYLQAVMAPLLCLALLGCQRVGRPGRWLAAFAVLLWGYILAATYVAKLFPLYGGFAGGRSTLREIAHWYLTDWTHTADILDTTALLPASCLAVLLAATLLTLLTILTILLRQLSFGADHQK